ncbi:MAG: MipA/OmpV family protein [Rubrivivax sp.]|nr:MipA/OmpV family protein [Rubrivivax sp.]
MSSRRRAEGAPGVALAGLMAPALALALAPVPAQAQRASAPAAGLPLWELGLGAGALSLPHYRGSDQSQQWLLPVPYAVYRGDILRADRDGARAVLLETERIDFDLSAGASAPAKSRDNRARSGMPDLEPTVEFGPNLNLTLGRGAGWKLDLRLPVTAVFTLGSDARHIGWAAAPNLNLDLRAQGWNIGLLAGPLFGSRAYHAHFYEVAPEYAAATRPAYRARGGMAGWRFTGALSRRSGDAWFGAFVRADSLAGARFDDSPLVRRRQHLSAGFALSWILKVSDARVADQP